MGEIAPQNTRHVSTYVYWTHEDSQQAAARATIDVRSRHRTNPRSNRFTPGKASEYRWQPPRYNMDSWSRRREVAHGVLLSSPKPEQLLFFSTYGEKWGSRLFVVRFLHTCRRYTCDLDVTSTHGQLTLCRARPVNTDDSSKIACGSMV